MDTKKKVISVLITTSKNSASSSNSEPIVLVSNEISDGLSGINNPNPG